MIELKNLNVKFGGVVALDDISATFSAPVSGIIGPNGAGKTTTMNVISGFLASSGKISFEGEDITALTAYQRTRWGLRRSFQHEQIADDLSVRDNLRVILDGISGGASEKRADLNRALKFIDFSQRGDTLAASLNSYERRLVDIARCLVGRPKVIMFDEPCGGLTQEETTHLGDLILQIGELTGAITLVIDHDVELIKRICTQTLVIDFGKRIAFGETAKVLEDPKVQAAYLGIEEVA
ncbi:MAG: hypothetical protein OFPI_40210 [Osedax symbiont Rs2]|nr:MAG: hypothetical protein OFPI_40210 [Osedax symbiont Rs2]